MEIEGTKKQIELEIDEIKKQIGFIGESVIETCRRQRGGFDFLED